MCVSNVLEIQPRMRGWLLASVDGQKVGIIPGNYVKVLGKKRGTKHQQQSSPGNTADPAQIPTLSSVNSASAPDMVSGTSTCCKKSCDKSESVNNGQVKPVASAPCMDNFNSTSENSTSFANLEDAFPIDSNSQNNSVRQPENLNAKDILDANEDKLIN